LVRLFRRHLETTPVAYIRKRRAEHAKHLLIHTTLPMKSIARQIGLTDLQQFNKLLRKTLGRSPRAIRFASQ
jgi:transcriptional regulator GlxA family with amidase domain